MQGLSRVLLNDRMDTEIIKGTLETLQILCSADKKPKDENNLGVMFTEIYIKVYLIR